MQEDKQTTKIGAGHAAAMARLGLRELRSAFYPQSNIAQQTEHGLYGSLTPGEVAEGKREQSLDLEQEQEKDSVLEERMREAERREGPEPESKEPERD
jgi:hypothetical protein